MSCKSAIYTANQRPYPTTLTAPQPTAQLELGTVVRRFGCNARLSGNGILLDGNGYYGVNVNVTITPEVAGDYTVALYEDGVAVPGAQQTVTVPAVGDAIAFSFPALVRLRCYGYPATLTLVLSTTATLPTTVTVNNVGVMVEKI